ncbi:uncharacterized protein BO80DRAFT_4355 [Aspergillus ibericus CBS 121593]|uniref:Uncharacterized protein n=1 Tax=Aspergillus ibericus CBS 121593 TaxID=1448316 RepID=A0A395HEF1_9EURO|nr:hypothetical protein BO80DRAFT_4355 [Aspergillus ibericus CBS 121593]RAL06237.1 hypothetical protein BO80DRAFT_4355 [Aspergillus ibericus CBS 121593]
MLSIPTNRLQGIHDPGRLAGIRCLWTGSLCSQDAGAPPLHPEADAHRLAKTLRLGHRCLDSRDGLGIASVGRIDSPEYPDDLSILRMLKFLPSANHEEDSGRRCVVRYTPIRMTAIMEKGTTSTMEELPLGTCPCRWLQPQRFPSCLSFYSRVSICQHRQLKPLSGWDINPLSFICRA